jgi:hypothetical protein
LQSPRKRKSRIPQARQLGHRPEKHGPTTSSYPLWSTGR